VQTPLEAGHSRGLASGPVRRSWPGGTADVVEYGRGVLQAFSYSSAYEAQEVHVLRLRNAFDRAGFAHALRYVLNVLTLMREAQELRGGYWFPTPIRLIPLDRTALVVAPVPTTELERHLPVSRAGYARYLSMAGQIDLPKQSLDEWAGFETSNTAAWTQEVLRRGSASLGPTIPSENVEFFALQQFAAASGRGMRATWVRESRLAILNDGRIALCRSRLGENYHRYFLGGIEKGRLTQETSAPNDVARLQYGIAAINGRPLLVEVTNEHPASILHIFSAIPRPERRLLLALANRMDSVRGKAYRVDVEEHSIILTKVLKNLGCDLRYPDAR
jgi:hypothetical protein